MKDFTCVEHVGKFTGADAWLLCDQCARLGVNKCKCGGHARFFAEALMQSVRCESCDESVMTIDIDAKDMWNNGFRGLHERKTMSKKYIIDVVTRVQDNGDGGYSCYVYNNDEEMLKDHPALEGCEESEKEKLSEIILGGEDDYEYGYLDTDKIEVEIVNGKAMLASGFSFSAGQ